MSLNNPINSQESAAGKNLGFVTLTLTAGLSDFPDPSAASAQSFFLTPFFVPFLVHSSSRLIRRMMARAIKNFRTLLHAFGHSTTEKIVRMVPPNSRQMSDGWKAP